MKRITGEGCNKILRDVLVGLFVTVFGGIILFTVQPFFQSPTRPIGYFATVTSIVATNDKVATLVQQTKIARTPTPSPYDATVTSIVGTNTVIEAFIQQTNFARTPEAIISTSLS